MAGRSSGQQGQGRALAFPWQGAPGAGLPGARGERGDPGPRVGTAAAPRVPTTRDGKSHSARPKGTGSQLHTCPQGGVTLGMPPCQDPLLTSLSSRRVKMGAQGQKAIAGRR